VWLDCLHLLSASLWGGVIIAFVLAVRPVLRRQDDAVRAAVATRYSTLAAAGLGLVAATGIYNAWQELGAWRPLWSTRYGLILDIKLGLVMLMALAGAGNRFRHVPAMANAARFGAPVISRRTSAFHALTVTSAIEALLMLAILA